ncbi:MAG: hypothetical protein MN733_03345 [Nitrososphaera sp.]|nr:hypothetical protein [Nitrososphaera sp.]
MSNLEKMEIVSPEKKEAVLSWLNEQFPEDDNITPILILVAKDNSLDVCHRNVCADCLLDIFERITELYFVKSLIGQMPKKEKGAIH